MSTTFKMKGFSGFGNSPLHDGKKVKGKLKTNIGEKLKKTKHLVTPPTEEQSKKSKGEFTSTSSLYHGTWDRPEIKKSFKREWGKAGDIISRDIKKIKKYIGSKLKN